MLSEGFRSGGAGLPGLPGDHDAADAHAVTTTQTSEPTGGRSAGVPINSQVGSLTAHAVAVSINRRSGSDWGIFPLSSSSVTVTLNTA